MPVDADGPRSTVLGSMRWSLFNAPSGASCFAVIGWLVAMVVPEVGTLFLDHGGAVAEPDLSGHAVALFGN